MIRAAKLSKAFGAHRVLEGLDIHVRPGERVALLGLNGAGKTTLMRCLMGLTPFAGSLSIAGHDVRSAPREAKRHLGYVPQRIPHFTGTLEEIVTFFTRLRGTDPRAVASTLGGLGLSLAEHGTKPIRTLSGGMLQKVLLGLALGADVPLLLLDEPTANLDAPARREFLRILRGVDGGTTILLASHRFADVEAVADRLVVLHGGRIVFDGSMTELMARAGVAATLWVTLPADARDAAERRLRDRSDPADVIRNGTAIGIAVDPRARADLLVDLRQAGLPIEDFWTETPSLHELLDGLLGHRRRGPIEEAR